MKNKILFLPCLLFCLFWGMQIDAAAVWPIEPQNSSHPIEHNYGDFEDTLGFHNGIDIPASAGTETKACITGVIRAVAYNDDPNSVYAGYVEICRSIPDTNNFWSYAHIYGIPREFKGALKYAQEHPESVTVIPTTDFYIGKVCHWSGHGGPTDHLHFMYSWEKMNYFHPLDSLRPLPDMKPNIDSVSFRKDKSSSRDDDFTSVIPNYGTLLYGDIDIIVMAHTDIDGNDKSGVNSISYEVKDKEGNVLITPLRVMDFRDLSEWEMKDLEKQSLLYDSTYRTKDNFFTAQGNPYIVTNVYRGPVQTGGVNVEERCWATKGKVGTTGTYATEEKARINKEAKFPDGEYIVTIHAYDYSDKKVSEDRQVVLDNFLPYIQSVEIKQGDTLRYSAHWPTTPESNTDLGELEIEENSGVFIGTRGFTMKIRFSEVMNTSKTPDVKDVKILVGRDKIIPFSVEWESDTILVADFNKISRDIREGTATLKFSDAKDMVSWAGAWKEELKV